MGFSTIDTDICDGAFKQSTPVAQHQAWIEETTGDADADCGSLKKVKVKDGSVKQDSKSTTVGATATVKCDKGFEPKKEKITCQASGEWEEAECEEIDCGSLKKVKVKDGSVKEDSKSTTVGATATVKCDKGFEPKKETITCQASGEWEDAECEEIDCGSLKKVKVKDGSVKEDSKSTTVGATATVKCDKGFEPKKETITCQASGEWEDAECEAIDCGSPKKIDDGSVKLDSKKTTAGSTATVKCDKGYDPSAETITCQESGKWEKATCTIRDCGSLKKVKVKDGSVKEDSKSTTVGATATVSCDEGYEPVEETITCQSSGEWEKAECEIVDCGALSKVSDGSVKLDSKKTTFGSTATVSCDEGYDPKDESITCQASGKWEKAKCEIKDCGSLPKVSDGSLSLDSKSTTFGSTATLTCDSGYEAKSKDMDTISCEASGTWEKAKCVPKDCGSPSVTDGSVSLDSSTSTFGSTASVTCNAGYDASVSTINCQASGSWEAATCIIKNCGTPSVTDGSVSLDSSTSTFGSTASVTCDAGYDASVSTINCQASGSWEAATCTIKDCGTPSIRNGSVIPDSATTTFGSTAAVSCDAGYIASVSSINCQASGDWEVATCDLEVTDCGVVPEVANGAVSLDSPSLNTTVGSTATVTCDSGYAPPSSPTITCTSIGWETPVCVVDPCKSGWTLFDNHCYYFYADGTTDYGSADTACGALGAYLVEITSAEENAFLVDLRDDSFDAFIGLTDEATEGTFVWGNSGAVATYTNWESGFPDSKDYVVMNAIGQWYTATNADTHYYFCEYDVSS